MRRILIDRARRKRAVRHGGQQCLDLQEVDIASVTDDDQILAVSEALDRVVVQHRAEAELVKRRYFVGKTFEGAPEVLGMSARTANDYSVHAQTRLFRELSAD